MTPEKKGPWVTKAQRKKMESEKKRAEEELRREEEARVEEEQKEKEKNGGKDPPIFIKIKAGKQNGHNCPSKDAAKTHRLTMRCFHQRHVGVCRVHENISSALDGCKDCNGKGDELQYSNIHLN